MEHGDVRGESMASEVGRQVVSSAHQGGEQGALMSGERDAAPRGRPATEPGDAVRKLEAGERS